MSAVGGDDNTFKNIWIFHMMNYSEVELQSQCFVINKLSKSSFSNSYCIKTRCLAVCNIMLIPEQDRCTKYIFGDYE